jgi:hypothetical protein
MKKSVISAWDGLNELVCVLSNLRILYMCVYSLLAE